ncbi:cytochrome-c peroxidase [Echinicola strongylocentroti]|uniref:Cytochrome-c peroxidase n=2 Tax=Echinicola strongylocentroti TaxID=1795355 RepID=A0A2Z4IFP5_9BACT|nr:cytochrome-c peroxidase [Echinicola strongylocentroti]
MKKAIIYRLLLLLCLHILLTGCLPDAGSIEGQSPDYIIPVIASSLLQEDFPQPERNPMSKQGVLLGKALFYDPALSANGKVDCASCHLPQLAFSDGVDLSDQGVSGKPLHRHSPALFNMAWHKGLFWDGGSNNLESLVFGPLTHPDEMAADLGEVIHYLRGDEKYPDLFKAAFETDTITSAFIGRALAQFVRTLISQDSRYDEWRRNEAILYEQETRGYQLYRQHCSSCHEEGLFTDLKYHNNGLDATYPDPYELEGLLLGRYRITFDDQDLGAYKTPSLRNIQLTAPYMHDGRFETLDEVLDHYENGIQHNGSLAPQLEKGISLTNQQREDLLAFLATLTDYTFINNKAYQK